MVAVGLRGENIAHEIRILWVNTDYSREVHLTDGVIVTALEEELDALITDGSRALATDLSRLPETGKR